MVSLFRKPWEEERFEMENMEDEQASNQTAFSQKMLKVDLVAFCQEV